jgi:IrrE N-terminal-like domain
MPLPLTARGWAQQLVHQLSPSVRAALAADPKRAIVEQLGLRVQTGDPGLGRGFGGWCDGLSITADDRIIYRPTPYSRRENFTLLHEAGHHHSEHDEALLNWAHQRPDPEQELERISDFFAATLLLPQAVVQRVLAGDPVGSRHLPLLYQESSASREVCAISLADELGCEGFVALVDLTSKTVNFAARAGETRPAPWRDDPLPAGHPLHRLQPGQDRRGDAWWPYPGGQRRSFYFDAAADDRRVYAVFAEHDLWGITRLHLTDPVPHHVGRGYQATFHCPTCQATRTTRRFPCSACEKPECPVCHECDCHRRARTERTATCRKCGMTMSARLVVNGQCVDCA